MAPIESTSGGASSREGPGTTWKRQYGWQLGDPVAKTGPEKSRAGRLTRRGEVGGEWWARQRERKEVFLTYDAARARL